MRVEDVPIAWSVAACRAAYKRADELRMNVNKADLQQCMDHIIAAVAPLIAAAERAECAKVCDDLRHPNYSSETDDWLAGTEACAAAIRARGEVGG